GEVPPGGARGGHDRPQADRRGGGGGAGAVERFVIAPDSEILIGRGFPRPLLPPAPARRRAGVVTQPGAEAIAARVASQLEEERIETTIHVMPDGEEAKALAPIEAAYEWLAEQIGRASCRESGERSGGAGSV